jgi:hypothetical protein
MGVGQAFESSGNKHVTFPYAAFRCLQIIFSAADHSLREYQPTNLISFQHQFPIDDKCLTDSEYLMVCFAAVTSTFWILSSCYPRNDGVLFDTLWVIAALAISIFIRPRTYVGLRGPTICGPLHVNRELEAYGVLRESFCMPTKLNWKRLYSPPAPLSPSLPYSPFRCK